MSDPTYPPPTFSILAVQRTNNGWLISNGNHADREHVLSDLWVATTPDELSAIVVGWALQQKNPTP
jgi:hypothetical protein